MNPALSNDGRNMRYTDSNSLLRMYDSGGVIRGQDRV